MPLDAGITLIGKWNNQKLDLALTIQYDGMPQSQGMKAGCSPKARRPARFERHKRICRVGGAEGVGSPAPYSDSYLKEMFSRAR